MYTHNLKGLCHQKANTPLGGPGSPSLKSLFNCIQEVLQYKFNARGWLLTRMHTWNSPIWGSTNQQSYTFHHSLCSLCWTGTQYWLDPLQHLLGLLQPLVQLSCCHCLSPSYFPAKMHTRFLNKAHLVSLNKAHLIKIDAPDLLWSGNELYNKSTSTSGTTTRAFRRRARTRKWRSGKLTMKYGPS